MSKQELIEWVTQQMNAQGWGVNETARRADLSNSYLSNVLNGKQDPGPKFYGGVARAFETDKAEIMRIAGELPPSPGTTERPTLRELWQLLHGLNEDQLKEIRQFARFLKENREKQ